MSRTRKCRKICGFPGYYSFIPGDEEAGDIETIMAEEWKGDQTWIFEKRTES